VAKRIRLRFYSPDGQELDTVICWPEEGASSHFPPGAAWVTADHVETTGDGTWRERGGAYRWGAGLPPPGVDGGEV